MSKPVLVIVNGSPASGKSSLVKSLADELGLPLFEKDPIKERIADAFDEDFRPHSDEFGEAAISQLHAIALELLESGHGLVIESFWEKGPSEELLQPLVNLASTAMIHVTAEHDVLVERFEERIGDPDRHPVHMDAYRREDFRALLDDGRAEPLDLDVPTIILDNTDTGIDEDAVAAELREILGLGNSNPEE